MHDLCPPGRESRAVSASRFPCGYRPCAKRLSLILATLEPLMKSLDVSRSVPFVHPIRDAVHSRAGFLSSTSECCIQCFGRDPCERSSRIVASLASSVSRSSFVYIVPRVRCLAYVSFNRYVTLFPPSLQWVPWPLLSETLRSPTFTGTMGLAPVGFH